MNLQKLMKQAQAMQANMANAQARLAEKTFVAEAAGGKIKATANGSGMITDLSIDPAVVDPDDAEFLTSLVLKAVQDALKKNKYVKKYRLGVYGEGEDGVTIAEFG